jgi:phage shock protein C
MEPRRTQFYLDKVNGKLGGVCSGIADYFGIDPLLVRIGWIAAMITLGLPFFLYFLVWWLAPVKPASLYAIDRSDDPEAKKFWTDVRVAPRRSIRDVHSRFRDIDRRLRDIEAHAVSSNTSLASQIDSLR